MCAHLLKQSNAGDFLGVGNGNVIPNSGAESVRPAVIGYEWLYGLLLCAGICI